VTLQWSRQIKNPRWMLSTVICRWHNYSWKEQRKGIKITRGDSGDIKERWMDDKPK
jgi:hypothetical protein